MVHVVDQLDFCLHIGGKGATLIVCLLWQLIYFIFQICFLCSANIVNFNIFLMFTRSYIIFWSFNSCIRSFVEAVASTR